VITVLHEVIALRQLLAAQRGLDYSHCMSRLRAGDRSGGRAADVPLKRHGPLACGLVMEWTCGVDELLRAYEAAFMVSSLVRLRHWPRWPMTITFAVPSRRMLRARSFSAERSQDGIRVVPTWTNFLFCHVGEDVSNLCQLLQEDALSFVR